MIGCRVRGLLAALESEFLRIQLRCALLAAAGLAVAVFLCSNARAEDAAGVAIAKLLEVGWANSPQARAAADAQWVEVQRVAGRDIRAMEASWLVLMQQRRFEEALKRLEEYLAKAPNDLEALRAKAWTQTVLKNYAQAFVTSERLSVLLSKNRPTTEEGMDEHEEAVAFLGRLIGFYGGPAADSINQDERKTLEKKWLERLDESTKVIFEDARNGVLSRFLEMTGESVTAKERAAANAKAEKEKSLAELQDEGDRLDAKTKELEEKRDKLNSLFKAEMDDINRQDQPLAMQQTQLAGRANLLNNDLANYSAQILTLQQLAANEKDANRQQLYFSQINSLSLLANRIDADLLTLNQQMGNLRVQRAGLQTRRMQAQANTATQVNGIEREMAEINKRERRNEVLEKKANRPTAANTGKVRSLTAQASALSTYDSFPLEAAKAKLLEALR